MEDIKTKEENRKKEKRKIMIISALMTIITVIIGICVLAVLLLENNNDNDYVVPNSYSFSGNILSTVLVYPDIYLVMEEKDNSIHGVTLKNNELISQKVFCSNIDYSEIKDFSVVLGEYNSDNTKDFIYLYDKTSNGYIYKFYSIDRNGNISELDIKELEIVAQRTSLKVTKMGDEYKYIVPSFYYDGYKVTSEIGEHELTEKSDINKKTISKTSKIAIDGKYNALPRKVYILDKVPDYVQNVNDYLLELENKECIEVDLDGDNQNEYIVGFIQDKNMYVSLFDNSSNFIVSLLNIEGEKALNKVIEIADVDEDGIMEIIVIKDNSLEVHRYNNGFYY